MIELAGARPRDNSHYGAARAFVGGVRRQAHPLKGRGKIFLVTQSEEPTVLRARDQPSHCTAVVTLQITAASRICLRHHIRDSAGGGRPRNLLSRCDARTRVALVDPPGSTSDIRMWQLTKASAHNGAPKSQWRENNSMVRLRLTRNHVSTTSMFHSLPLRIPLLLREILRTRVVSTTIEGIQSRLLVKEA